MKSGYQQDVSSPSIGTVYPPSCAGIVKNINSILNKIRQMPPTEYYHYAMNCGCDPEYRDAAAAIKKLKNSNEINAIHYILVDRAHSAYDAANNKTSSGYDVCKWARAPFDALDKIIPF
jgi:hypothetical protein